MARSSLSTLQVLPDGGVSLGSFLDPTPSQIPPGGGRYLQDVLLDVPGEVRQRGPIDVQSANFPSLPSNFRTFGMTSLPDPNGTDAFRLLLLGADYTSGVVKAYVFGRGTTVATPTFTARAFFDMPLASQYGNSSGEPYVYLDDRRLTPLTVGTQLAAITLDTLSIATGQPDPYFDAKASLDSGVLIGVGMNYGHDSSSAAHRSLFHWRGAGKPDFSGTFTVTQNSKTVTVASGFTANVEPGMFLLSSNRLLGIVASVDSDTSLTLERNVLSPSYTGTLTFKSIRRPLLTGYVSTGSINASTSSAVINGGDTKFVDQGVANGDQVFRANDWSYVGTVSTIQSNEQLTLSANALVGMNAENYLIARTLFSSTDKVPVFSMYFNGMQMLLNADNQRRGQSELSRIFITDPDLIDAVDLTKDGTFYDLPSVKPHTAIRGGFPTESAALVFLAEETYGLFGNEPTALSPRIVLADDGCLSPMSVQPWQAGCVWAGHRSVYHFDGAKVTDLLAGRARLAHQRALSGLDYGELRCWSMLYNGHYTCFLQQVNPGVFTHTQARTSSTDSGGSTTNPTTIVYSINLLTGALVFWTNVEIRGFTSPPGKLVNLRDAYYVVENSNTIGPAICSAESLYRDNFDLTKYKDDIPVDPGASNWAPHFYVEGRLNAFGDGELLKSFKQVQYQHMVYAPAGSNAQLGLDVFTGLSEDSEALPTKPATMTSTAAGEVWANKRSRFLKRSNYLGVRFYSLSDGLPGVIKLQNVSVGLKPQRPGRV